MDLDERLNKNVILEARVSRVTPAVNLEELVFHGDLKSSLAAVNRTL